MIRLVLWNVLLAAFLAASADADCINKFMARTQGNLQNVTLLTGTIDFDAAQQLAAAIRDKKADPLEWVDESGKRIAQQFGEVKVVRPMPVSCDGHSSGVILAVAFPNAVPPTKKMRVRLAKNTVVAFEEQSE